MRSESSQKITRWVMFGLVVVAWIFSCVSVSTCKFFGLENGSDDKQGFGLFSYEFDTDESRCLKYSDDNKDDLGSPLRASRAFGVMALVFSGFAMLGFLSVVLFLRGGAVRNVWMVSRVLLAPSVLFQLLTFSIFAIDYCSDPEKEGLDKDAKCKPVVGGAMSILAAIFFLIASVLSCIVPAPKNPVLLVTRHPGEVNGAPAQTVQSPPSASFQHAQEKVTVVNQPDGCQKIIKEVENPDGSRTITESVTRPKQAAPTSQTQVAPTRPIHATVPGAVAVAGVDERVEAKF